jgi:hypothetical protein
MGLKAYIVKVTVRDSLTIDVEVRATGKQDARRKALQHLTPTWHASAGQVTLIKGKGRYA